MRSIASFVGLALAAVAAAQEPTQQDAAGSAAASWQMVSFPALEGRVGGLWQAHWNPGTKTPDAIYGTGIRIEDWRGNTLEEARRHANQALLTYGDLLRLGSCEYRESIGAPMGNSWSFTYDQYCHGLPCIGGRADVRINGSGVIALLGSVVLPIPDDFDTRPVLDEANATARAWLALGQEPTGVSQPAGNHKPRLVIWGDVDAPSLTDVFLAWEIPVSNLDFNGNGPVGRYYIDARNGNALHYRSDKHDCCFAACRNSHHGLARTKTFGPPVALPAPVPTTVTVLAWTRTGQSAIAALVNTPAVGLVVNVPGIGAVTTDQNGQFTIDIAAPVTITVTNMDGIHNLAIVDSSANGPNASVTVSPGVNATLQILTNAATPAQAAHTSCQFWLHTANEWVRTIVGNSSQMNTADSVRPTVNIAATCNAFYTGNTVNFYAAGGSCNNTAFSTVMVHEWGHGIDDRYGGISNSATDGLSEGWGDIFGMYHPLVDNPIVGIDFTTSGGFVRTGLNTRMYGTGTEVHASGEVWMGFAWRLRDNLRAAFGTPQAIAISNHIVIGSVVANATNQANAVIQVFTADDDDGNLLNGTPHYAQLSAAAIAKGMPYPQIQLGTLTHAPLPNTPVELTPREVLLSAVPLSGSFTAVNLVYRENGGPPVTRGMLPTGVSNQYHAMLPGEVLASTVAYHFSAIHSTGPVVSLPASGDYSYMVTNDVVVFSEGFEAGFGGWTHALVATQDDWQVGDPAGFSGAGWTDPQNAAVGLACAGNDLGIGNFNGAYQPNVNNYLHSPFINCSGRTGVRLRFKRWLTVQNGSFDHASIAVNGTQVWTNPAGGNTIDTAWTQIDLPIPLADNNPSVQLEWRLVTDASGVFGGWAIDDVQVVAAGTATPLAAQLRIQPEQAAVDQPMLLSVVTQGPQPFLLAIGDTPGPTNIPGIPTILVGGNATTLPGFTNALGLFQMTFNAGGSAPPNGYFWYSQVLTLDTLATLVTSNQGINLFTP